MSLKNLIFPAILAVGSIGAAALYEIFKDSDRISKSKALELAEKNMDIEAKEVLRTVDEAVKKSDKVFKNEQIKLKKELEDWAKVTNFDKKVAEIKKFRDEAVKKVNQDFNLSDKKDAILREADQKLASYKEQIGYSTRTATLQNEIDSAKSMYDMQKQTLKLTTSDDSMYQELKKTAKRVKNTSVENAERELKALQSRVEEKSKIFEGEATRKIDILQKDLSSQVENVTKQYDLELDKMTSDRIAKMRQLQNAIVDARSSEDTDIVNTAKDLTDRAEEISKVNRDVADVIYSEMPRSTKLANYFVAKKWPKAGVIALSVAPIIPVAVVIVKYFAFVKDILSAMNS